MSLSHETATALFPVPCPVCDGLGEWDEGPLPASSGATEPDYRQVRCPECEGTGRIMAEAEPRTFDDLVDEADERMVALDATLAALHEPLMKPTCDETGHWRYVPAAEIDGPRVPAEALAAVNLDPLLYAAVASALNVPFDPARAAVEGRQIEQVA